VKTNEDHSPEKVDRALLAGWQAPDLLGIGVVVCDASCQMLIANQTAIDILAARDGLCLSPEGQLLATDARVQSVEDLVHRCTYPAGSVPARGRACFSAKISRSSGRMPLTLLARPFRSAQQNAGAMTLLLLLDFPHTVEADGIAPLLRLLSASQSWSQGPEHREGVH
jgi:hypothetical protein